MNPQLSDLQLVLFFTRGVSLKEWKDTGMLHREIADYLQMLPHLHSITFVTYGDERDLALLPELGGIQLICNQHGLDERAYIQWLLSQPLVNPNKPAIFKSNQVWGSEVPLQAARKLNKKCLIRCGYLFSDFMEREHGQDSIPAQQARELEATVFKLGDACVVTTAAMASVVQNYQVPRNKIQVIPNYVMTDVFKPNPERQVVPNQACFVGRLNPQKNPFALVDAFKDTPYRLAMAGKGKLKVQLRRHIRKEQLPVDLLGNLPHTELPNLLNSSALFVLPSHYERHPKTLLEAMSCGRPVVACNVSGIQQEIRHGHNGFLCETDSASIRQAIDTVMNDPQLAKKLGDQARKYILERYSLSHVVEKELALYEAMLKQ